MKKVTTSTHEWIRIEANQATVGIMQEAVRELGEIVFIELPKVGMHVQEGQEVVVLESTKAAVDVYSPVSGTIECINSALLENPNLLNQKSESEGWLYKVALLSPE